MIHEVLDDENLALRPTTAYVDLKALWGNVQALKARVAPARVMGIVKANAYGHGLVRVATEILAAGVDCLGVAFLEEGISLRRAGVSAPILVLGGIIGNQIRHFLEYDLEITASSPYKLQQIEAVAALMGKRARIHLKIDTGMERIGVHWDHAQPLLEAAIRSSHCDLAGIFSHLAASDSPDKKYTRLQLERFLEVTDFFSRRGLPTPPRHLANSGAILQHPETFLEMVRPGILLYGVYPSATVPQTVVVRPVLSLQTRVVYFKVVRAGDPVSYDGTWVAPQDTRVVTLPVGYGDGYSRLGSGQAQVLLNGKKYPVVGRITMDALMVDIGQNSAYNGDIAVLLGQQGEERITVETIAGWLGTIPYEVLTMINTRVPRRYLG